MAGRRVGDAVQFKAGPGRGMLLRCAKRLTVGAAGGAIGVEAEGEAGMVSWLLGGSGAGERHLCLDHGAFGGGQGGFGFEGFYDRLLVDVGFRVGQGFARGRLDRKSVV